jgi:5-(carboxyamino)imidazole ribonucleotide synthase
VENCPAAQVADFHVQADFTDRNQVLDFAAQVDVVTIETELVPWTLLAEIESSNITRPSSSVLALVQDRLVQREFLQDHRFPQTSFASVKNRTSLTSAAQGMTFPAILKRRRSGYDGKGQIRISNPEQLDQGWKELGEAPSVLEAVVPFTMELSVVLARSVQGSIHIYPLAENTHRRNILHTTRVPARVAERVRIGAEELATSLLRTLDYCGIMAVEFFLLKDDSLLINEIAPRPHNTGHFTFGACRISQFEQHLRAICGLPLGDSSLIHPVVMMNLLGDLWRNGPPSWDRLLAHPQVQLHLYGKHRALPGRKMGHFLLMDENTEHALHQAESLLQSLMEAKAPGREIPHETSAKEPFPRGIRPLETPG